MELDLNLGEQILAPLSTPGCGFFEIQILWFFVFHFLLLGLSMWCEVILALLNLYFDELAETVILYLSVSFFVK